jgi:hypothetical protein
MLKRLEWLFRRSALQEARAHLPPADSLEQRAFEQARLLREVTRRLAEQVDEVGGGSRPAVFLLLLQDLVYWALVSRGNDGDRDRDADVVRQALVGLEPPQNLEATDADVARVRGIAESLYEDLAAPRRRVDRVRRQRWVRLAATCVAVLAVVLVARVIARGPNLAAGKPMRTSSSWSGCSSDAGCIRQLFHTNSEDNPWVEFDLGAPTRVRRLEVKNRSDCCHDRAVPLVAELSDDRTSWKEVARRDEIFPEWTATFPPTTARYVRLRVARNTVFHLNEVVIR